MVATLRRRGIMVQAEGIESASHLRMAMEADVDMFLGSLLGEPALAGAAFDEEPRPVASLLGGFGNIVTLFAR
jgi:EAL domain-containing protein (putative c-di-GMP-specific phosphodiesterase class I)